MVSEEFQDEKEANKKKVQALNQLAEEQEQLEAHIQHELDHLNEISEKTGKKDVHYSY